MLCSRWTYYWPWLGNFSTKWTCYELVVKYVECTHFNFFLVLYDCVYINIYILSFQRGYKKVFFTFQYNTVDFYKQIQAQHEILNTYVYKYSRNICETYVVSSAMRVLQHGYLSLTWLLHGTGKVSVIFNMRFYKSVCCTFEELYGALLVGCAFCVWLLLFAVAGSHGFATGKFAPWKGTSKLLPSAPVYSLYHTALKTSFKIMLITMNTAGRFNAKN